MYARTHTPVPQAVLDMVVAKSLLQADGLDERKEREVLVDQQLQAALHSGLGGLGG